MTLGIDTDRAMLVDFTEEVEIRVPRYLVHVSEIRNRSWIQKKGLIPRNADSKKWGYIERAMGIPAFNNSVFASIVGDDLDIFKAQRLDKYAFALPMLIDHLPENFFKKIEKISDKYKSRAEKIKSDVENNPQKRGVDTRLMMINDIYKTLNDEINNVLKKHSKVDFWMIDTLGLKNKWYEDHFGGEDGVYPGDPGFSVYTKQTIPWYHLYLVKPGNKNVIVNYDEEPSAYNIAENRIPPFRLFKI